MSTPIDRSDPDQAPGAPADAAGAPAGRDAGPVDDPEAQARADDLEVKPEVAREYSSALQDAADRPGEGQVP